MAEFNSVITSNELIIICYFQESLKSFIKVEIKQQDQKSRNFEEIVQKTINIKAKVRLKSSIIIQNLDFCYPKSHYPFNTISTTSKVQTKEITIKK